MHGTGKAQGAADAVSFIEDFDCYPKSNKKPLKAYRLWNNEKHSRKLTVLTS